MALYPIVCLDHVSFIRNGTRILKDIDLSIDHGQHWAIMGKNGSGKTSLISIINGYHHPSEGKARVFGEKFGSVDLRELRRRIGTYSDEIHDMIHTEDSGEDIVISGKFASIGLYEEPEPEDHIRADFLFDFFGIKDMKKHRFATLSDGEKQKILLARALMPEPELLILDEPCSGLDIKAREDFLDSLQKTCSINGGPTLVYVTHHIEEVISAITHAAAMKGGRVLASGKKEDVLTDEVLSKTFDVSIKLHKKGGRIWPIIIKKGEK